MTDHAPTRGKRERRLLPVALAAAAFLLAACGEGLPQNTLEPAGDIADRQRDLFMIVFWIAVVVFVVVEGALLYVSFRYRRRRNEEAEQVHGNTRLEIVWTVIPALILAGLAFPTVGTIFSLARKPPGQPLEITVTGHQWWWEFEYGEGGVVTANEMVIPVGQPVYLRLLSDETPGGLAGFTDDGRPIPEDAIPVIHSFWVPRLAGKQDLVPGREEQMNIEADAPGTYMGQCAEFCGISHANMRLRVRALPPNEFTAWVAEQKADAREPLSADAIAGRELFFDTALLEQNSCINCHVIRGTDAAARVGPDLTHFADRTMFAGTMFETNETNVFNWIKNTRAMKPGVVMPVFEGLLTDEQIRQLTAYILSLE